MTAAMLAHPLSQEDCNLLFSSIPRHIVAEAVPDPPDHLSSVRRIALHGFEQELQTGRTVVQG